MSTFNTGSGSLSSTNLPAVFLEIAALLQVAESTIVDNSPDNLTLTSDIDGKSFGVSISMPTTASVNTSGQATITASDYITTAGGISTIDTTGSDLKSTNLPAALMKISQLLHNAEKLVNPEPDNIQITYNLENGTVDINATIPQSISVSNGAVIITATDYV